MFTVCKLFKQSSINNLTTLMRRKEITNPETEFKGPERKGQRRISYYDFKLSLFNRGECRRRVFH